MSNVNLLVVGVTTGVLIASAILLPFLKKKGVKVDEVINKTETAVNDAQNVLKIADKVLPNNPLLKTLEIIADFSGKGAKCAEQLYLTSKLPEEQRNNKAKDTVYNALGIAGITVTPEIDQLVKDTVEAEVLALGHKSTDVKAQIDAAKVLQADLQAKNDALAQENAQLKQTINTVQSTVAATSTAETVNAEQSNITPTENAQAPVTQ